MQYLHSDFHSNTFDKAFNLYKSLWNCYIYVFYSIYELKDFRQEYDVLLVLVLYDLLAPEF